MELFSKYYIHLVKFLNFLLGSILGLTVAFFTLRFLNSELSTYNMGVYSYTLTIMTLLFPLVSLGLYNTYIRFEPKYSMPKLLGFVIKRIVLLTIALSLILYCIFDDLYYCAFSFILLFYERLYFYRSKEVIWLYNLLNVGQKSLFLFLLYFFSEGLNPEIIFLVLGLSYLFFSCLGVLLGFSLGCYNGNTYTDEKVEINKQEIFKYCFSAALISSISWVAASSDQVLIKYYFGFESVAPYAVAFKIVSLLALFAGVFLSYFPTVYFKSFESEAYDEARNIRAVFIFLLSVAVFALFFLREFLYRYFGADKYVGEIDYFVILLFSEYFRLVSSTFFIFKSFQLMQRHIMFSIGLVSFLNIALNLLMLKVYGPIFAAYSSLFCYVVYFLISYVYSYRAECNYIISKRVV